MRIDNVKTIKLDTNRLYTIYDPETGRFYRRCLRSALKRYYNFSNETINSFINEQLRVSHIATGCWYVGLTSNALAYLRNEGDMDIHIMVYRHPDQEGWYI